MEKFTPNISIRNTPFPSESQFILSVRDEIVDFIKISKENILLQQTGMADNKEKFEF